MSDPRASVDLALLDEVEDAWKVGAEGIAAGEQGEFPPMEKWIIDEDRFFGDPHKNNAPCVAGEVQGVGHGTWVTRGIKHNLGTRLIGQLRHDVNIRVMLLNEGAAVGIEFKNGDACLGEMSKFEDRQTDGACSDDEHILAGLNGGALDGMAADGERLDKGELIVIEGVAGMQFVGRQQQGLPHPSVHMHAENAETFTAVAAALKAGVAGATVQVRFDRTTISRFNLSDAGAGADHLNAQLVSENARVVNEGHLSQIAGDVGAADANGSNRDEGLAWSR